MKKAGWAISLVVCWGLYTCNSEASVSSGLKNAWIYTSSPVNCLLEAGKGLVSVGINFVTCFLSNMNRNPVTLNGPIIN